MKYTSAKGKSKSVQRTLRAFEEAMFTLLSKKEFEKISVSKICDYAYYPRATFYNYFNDKYDLLDFCWNSISQNIHLDRFDPTNVKQSFFEVFDQIYELFSSYQELLVKIIKNNPLNSQLVLNFIHHFSKILEKLLNETLDKQKTKIPIELLARQYSNAAIIILSWIFLEGHPTTIDQAHQYLTILVGINVLPS